MARIPFSSNKIYPSDQLNSPEEVNKDQSPEIQKEKQPKKNWKGRATRSNQDQNLNISSGSSKATNKNKKIQTRQTVDVQSNRSIKNDNKSIEPNINTDTETNNAAFSSLKNSKEWKKMKKAYNNNNIDKLRACVEELKKTESNRKSALGTYAIFLCYLHTKNKIDEQKFRTAWGALNDHIVAEQSILMFKNTLERIKALKTTDIKPLIYVLDMLVDLEKKGSMSAPQIYRTLPIQILVDLGLFNTKTMHIVYPHIQKNHESLNTPLNDQKRPPAPGMLITAEITRQIHKRLKPELEAHALLQRDLLLRDNKTLETLALNINDVWVDSLVSNSFRAIKAGRNSNISDVIPKEQIQHIIERGHEKIEKFYDFTTATNHNQVAPQASLENDENNNPIVSPTNKNTAKTSKDILIGTSKRALSLSIDAYTLRERTLFLLRHFAEIPPTEAVPESLLETAKQVNEASIELAKKLAEFGLRTTDRALTTEQRKLMQILNKFSPTDDEIFV